MAVSSNGSRKVPFQGKNRGSIPRTATISELAYCAGLFDGEGCIAVIKYRSSKNGAMYLRPQLRITNTNRECLEFFREVFGCGTVYDRKPIPGCKQQYNYGVANANAAAIARQMLPFLIIKRDHVTRLLDSRMGGRADMPDSSTDRTLGSQPNETGLIPVSGTTLFME